MAIRLEPRLAAGYANRGLAYAQLGQPERAIEDLGEAIRLNPQLPESYRTRAYAYTILGKDNEAREDVERAVELGVDRTRVERAIEELKQQR